MTARIDKEFHHLFWPWVITSLLGLLPLLSWISKAYGTPHFFSQSLLIADNAYFLAVVLCAVLPFGMEFHQQTMPLLFSQPCTRRRIWREKVVVALIAMTAIMVAHLVGRLPVLGKLQENWVLIASFTLVLFSSGLCWTLVTRTIIGGLALSLTTWAVIYLLAFAFTSPAYFIQGTDQYGIPTELFQTLASLALTPLFLWVAWWRFSRLQVAGDWESRMESAVPHQVAAPFSSILATRPTRWLQNVIFKEIRLHAPVFFMMMLFSGLWLLAVFLSWALPARREMLTFFIDGCSSIYVPVILLLSGCASLCEEKKLGVHGINLTSPLSTTKQWLLKNVMASLAGLLATYGLFKALAWLTGDLLAAEGARIVNLPWDWEDDPLLIGVLIMVIQFAFWAATVASRPIHAATLGLVGGAIFYGLTSAFGFLGTMMHMGWTFPRTLELIMSWFQMPFSSIDSLSNAIIGWLYLLTFSPVIVAGSLCFRRLQGEKRQLAFSARATLPWVIILAILSGAFLDSLSDENWDRSSLAQETKAAFIKLQANIADAGVEKHVGYTFHQALDTGELSARTAEWLRGSSFTVSHYPMGRHTIVKLSIHFPKGTDSFYLPSATISPPASPSAPSSL